MERNTGISKRTTIYGKDAEGQSKRFCDIVLIDGSPCLEVKDRYGHKVWASVDAAKAAIHELTKNNKT